MISDYIFTPTHYFRELSKEEIFPNADAPLEVDLGCGEGHFIEGMAMKYPERNFLAVERLQGRVKTTANRLNNRGLKNAKVLRLETAYTVSWLLPRASVSRLHLLCPDPWPKKKHHARRLVNRPDFLQGLRRIIEPNGEFLLKTDDVEYYENSLESMQGLVQPDATGTFFTPKDWAEDEFFYPMTGFEKHWLGLGRSIQRARWVKSQG